MNGAGQSFHSFHAVNYADRLVMDYGYDGAVKYVYHILLFPDVMMREGREDGFNYEFWVSVKRRLEERHKPPELP